MHLLHLIPVDEYGFAPITAKPSGSARQNGCAGRTGHLEHVGYLQRMNRVGAGEPRTPSTI